MPRRALRRTTACLLAAALVAASLLLHRIATEPDVRIAPRSGDTPFAEADPRLVRTGDSSRATAWIVLGLLRSRNVP